MIIFRFLIKIPSRKQNENNYCSIFLFIWKALVYKVYCRSVCELGSSRKTSVSGQSGCYMLSQVQKAYGNIVKY